MFHWEIVKNSDNELAKYKEKLKVKFYIFFGSPEYGAMLGVEMILYIVY